MTAPTPPRRNLGTSGIEVSALAWGTWRFAGQDVRVARAKIEAALGVGITLFDTADVYGPGYGEPYGAAETMLGRIMKEAPHLATRMVISTKGGIRRGAPVNSSAAYLGATIHGSLQRLGVDAIDLWQIHRPDILTHPEEIARALDDAYRAGKIRAVGLSNFTPSQTNALRRYLPMPIVSHQHEFSALMPDPLTDGILDQAIEHNMAVLAWSPLAGGRIANPQTDRERAVAAALDAKAEAAGVSRTAAAYSWIMAHPARPIPIVGSQNLERIVEAGTAVQVIWDRPEWYTVLQAGSDTSLP